MVSKRFKIIWGAFTICLFVFAVIYEYKNIFRLHEEYAPMTMEQAIDGEILSKKIKKNMCFIQVDSIKFSFSDSWNFDYNPESIQMYLYKGNHFTKNAGSDSITIVQGKRELIFVHEKVLNEEKR